MIDSCGTVHFADTGGVWHGHVEISVTLTASSYEKEVKVGVIVFT